MRIIDKNKDYYDYFQNIYKDDTFTFDRRGSYPFTKEDIIHSYYSFPTHFLLQVCNNFWLIKINWFETKSYFYQTKYDYTLELEKAWIDYNAPRKELSLIGIVRKPKWNKPDVVISDYNKHSKWEGNKYVEYTCIPILKDIGIPSVVDGFEIYKALEEYFGTEKTASERSEAIGTTNDDKILSHGFDIKSSFRGKNT